MKLNQRRSRTLLLTEQQFESLRALIQDETIFEQLVAMLNAPESLLSTSILDLLHCPVVIVDPDSRIIRINRTLEQLTGLSTEQTQGQRVWDFMTPLQDLRRPYYAALDQQHLAPHTVARWDNVDGTEHIFQWTFETQTAFSIWTGVEITEQNRIDHALQQSEARYRQLLTQMNDGLIIEDAAGCVTFVNPKLCDLLGYRQTDLLRQPLPDFLMPEGRAAYDQHRQQLQQGLSTTYEIVWQSKNGGQLWTIIAVAPLLDSDGVYQGSLSVVTDITERIVAEEALRLSESRYRWLVTHMTEGLGMIDTAGKMTFVNEALAEMLGYRTEEMLGQPIRSFLTPDGRSTHAEQMSFRQQGQSGIYELEWLHKNNDKVWTLVSADPMADDDGTYQGSFGVITNITERRQTEEALRESEARFRRLLEVAPEIILVHHDNIIQFVNSMGAKLLGYENPQMLIGMSLHDIIDPAYHEVAQQQIRYVLDYARIADLAEQQWIRIDGQAIDVEVRTVPIQLQGRLMCQVVARDITERREQRRAIEDSERRLRAITSTLGEGVFVLDYNGRVTFMNPEAERLLGWMETELIEQPIHALIHVHDSDDCAILRTLSNGRAERVTDDTFLRRDGVSFPVSYVCTPLLEDGQVMGAVTAFHDITERKQADLEREKLIVELDAFAGTVAHDLKNPLNIIGGYSQVLAEVSSALPPDIGDLAHSINKQIRRMDAIIEELLLLAGVRGLEIELSPLDMGQLVADSLDRIEFFLEDHPGEIIVPDEWPTALGYGPWVVHVWVNYLTNGLKYGGNPPCLELGANTTHNGYVRFWLKDNGAGLSHDEQAALFVPFSRLSKNIRAKGYGLGLSIVKRIIERLGGTVGVESTLGEGSTFFFTLKGVD